MNATTSSLFAFRRDELLVTLDGRVPHTHVGALLGLDQSRILTLSGEGEQQHACSWLADDAACPEGHEFKRMRALYTAWAPVQAALAGTAFQLAQWARTHQFCGACGGRTQPLAGERCMKCSACGHMAYPRISPAMMVLIRKGDQALMALPANSLTGRYSALAGFLEAGETVEQAVHREVAEEVGLRVHRLEYFGSQSWPFPHSLMLAFTAEYLDGELNPDPREIAEARWVGPNDEWPEFPDLASIAGALIRAHRERFPPRLE